MRKPAPRKKTVRVGSSRTVRGKITQVSVCPHGLMEGFTLGGAFIKIPPHHDAEAALKRLAVGDAVTVRGEVIATRPNHVLHHVAIRRQGKVVFDHDEIEPHHKPGREPRRTAMDLTGKVLAVGTRKHGEVDRMLLSGNVSVHLEPGDDIEVKLGDEVRVKGKGTKFRRGMFVRARSILAL